MTIDTGNTMKWVALALTVALAGAQTRPSTPKWVHADW